MAFKPINLIDFHFQHSNLFSHLPIFDEIYYAGNPQENVQLYKAVREGQECTLLAMTFVRKDEDVLWASAQDLLSQCIREAAFQVQGVYVFDLLTFDIQKEINNFNYKEFSQVIVNHSLKTKPGEQRLVKYSSAFGLLQKMTDERWGKIVYKSAVAVYNDKPSLLYTLVARLFKMTEFSRNPAIVWVNDLSTHPVYDPRDKIQQEFLSKVLTEQSKQSIEFLPELYIQDKNGVRELMSGTVVKSG
jgi:hypothetical protein